MPYLLLIVEPRGQRAACPQDEAHRRYDAMMAYAGELQRDGLLLRAESLRPDDTPCASAAARRTQKRRWSTAPSPKPRRWSAAFS